jgi:transketolase
MSPGQVPATSLDDTCINTLRFLAVDAVERARSGHPGMPLGAAPMAYVLWDRFLRHNPRNPGWCDRDRFLLSAGHGCALLYALLHLTGYDLPLAEIQRFRQWGSKTPGHPERGLVPGVEATTGPLGQGFAMGVGMAIAERWLAARFNRPGLPVVDHRIYAIVSDGDLMEGISSEAASLAGTLGLGKLIYLYDSNGFTIEGSTGLAFKEDVAARFAAYGWDVRRVDDGNDLAAIEEAVTAAREDVDRPSLVIVRTHIGYGSPKQDSAEAHGEPLGPEAVAAAKRALGWPQEPAFLVPDEARAHMGRAVERGAALELRWQNTCDAYRRAEPDLAMELDQMIKGVLPEGWERAVPKFAAGDGEMATRDSSGRIMNSLAGAIKNLVGGSADLGTSTKTMLKTQPDLSFERADGRNLHYGVREHAMGAITNGMAIHGGLVPYASTFLIFSDYMRPALRFAAMMQAPAIFVFSHDSVALGEDGPTHQPVEHLMSLRAMPGLTVIRPADAEETAAAWRAVLERRKPAALILTRQRVPLIVREGLSALEGVGRGAYVLSEDLGGDLGKSPGSRPDPDIVLIATGSEVHLALDAGRELARRGKRVRVVSMPSWEIFEEQPEEYKSVILPAACPKLAIEAGATLGWHKYVGERGAVIGIDRFGASGPGPTVYENMGLTRQRVLQEAGRLLADGT